MDLASTVVARMGRSRGCARCATTAKAASAQPRDAEAFRDRQKSRHFSLILIDFGDGLP